MRRTDWLLLFLAYHGAPDGLDPVRLQKGMFLFAREGGRPQRETYTFKPYDYGPMSGAIYKDLDQLVQGGLLAAEAVPGKSWTRYGPTDFGLHKARELLGEAADLDSAAMNRLYEIKQDVASRTFEELLEYVYDRYPDMAVNSVFLR